jgi:hypothetical protein
MYNEKYSNFISENPELKGIYSDISWIDIDIKKKINNEQFNPSKFLNEDTTNLELYDQFNIKNVKIIKKKKIIGPEQA